MFYPPSGEGKSMPDVRFGDLNLYYELVDCSEPWRPGRPPLVLLHGLGTDRRIWLYQIPPFCSHLPVIAVDLRGHGRSSAPAGEWTIAEMAQDVVRLLRHLGAEKGHLVGLSMGGMVAQQFALDYPYATASLTLVDTAAHVPPAAAQESLRFMDANPMKDIAASRITTALSEAVDPAMLRHFIEQVALNDKVHYLQAARAVFGFDARARLSEIAAPTLVVLGEADRTFQHEWMTGLATAIPGARLQRLAGAGHLSNLEKPQEFNRALMEFLGL
jgi:3-oxoadipate enol-lactonase